MPSEEPYSPFVSKMLADANVPPDFARLDWVEIPPDSEEERRTQIVGGIQDMMAGADEHSPLWEALSIAEDHAWTYLRAYQDANSKGAADG